MRTTQRPFLQRLAGLFPGFIAIAVGTPLLGPGGAPSYNPSGGSPRYWQSEECDCCGANCPGEDCGDCGGDHSAPATYTVSFNAVHVCDVCTQLYGGCASDVARVTGTISDATDEDDTPYRAYGGDIVLTQVPGSPCSWQGVSGLVSTQYLDHNFPIDRTSMQSCLDDFEPLFVTSLPVYLNRFGGGWVLAIYGIGEDECLGDIGIFCAAFTQDCWDDSGSHGILNAYTACAVDTVIPCGPGLQNIFAHEGYAVIVPCAS